MEREGKALGDRNISLPLAGCRFNLRVSGLLLRAGRVLASQSEGVPYFYPPGGRIEENEDSAAALCREWREELGHCPPIERLLWVAESFFWEETSDERFHEIGFYYLLRDDGRLPDEPFSRPDELGCPHRFLWHPLADIDALDLRPAFLKAGLLDLPAHTVHLLDVQDPKAKGG